MQIKEFYCPPTKKESKTQLSQFKQKILHEECKIPKCLALRKKKRKITSENYSGLYSELSWFSLFRSFWMIRSEEQSRDCLRT